jgi:hypothetical protein
MDPKTSPIPVVESKPVVQAQAGESQAGAPSKPVAGAPSKGLGEKVAPVSGTTSRKLAFAEIAKMEAAKPKPSGAVDYKKAAADELSRIKARNGGR